MSDDDWEKLEHKNDIQILNIYMPKVPGYYTKIFDEIIEEFREEIPNFRYMFELFKPEDYEFKFDYFKEEDFEGEEWKQIGKLNYEISNYGRIKNTQTKN